MALADRRWYHLHLGTKILLAVMLAGAAPEIYYATYDIFYGPAGDPCPELDILEIGFIFTVIAAVTATSEWLIRGRYLQLHLSTAFLLMVLASGCVWLNALPATLQSSYHGGWLVEGRGWPCSTFSAWCRELKDAQDEIAKYDKPLGTWILNGIICLVLLFAVAFICEWRIRAVQSKKISSQYSDVATSAHTTGAL